MSKNDKVCIGIDCYNQSLTGGVAHPLRNKNADNDHIPCVIVNEPKSFGVVTKGNGDCFLIKEKHTTLSVGGGQAGQGYPCVIVNKSEDK